MKPEMLPTCRQVPRLDKGLVEFTAMFAAVGSRSLLRSAGLSSPALF